AKGLNAKGLTVAVVGYDLCPQVRVSDIIRQVRQACLFLFWRYGQRMLVSGHSAGGHLAACMVATDWSALDDGAPPDMIPSGLAISGVFDLAPLLGLPQNQDLRLTPEEARQVSPIHWEVGPGRALDIAVGGAESPAFRAQSRALADAWSARGVATTFREIPGANHFTALDPLPDANGDMVRGLVAMAQKLG
ncbi:MAG: alpha/beta hydrolase, partial [Rhizobiales bacterium]|nr:alpha/beta hydrolase [Hyphomicrobiales bacterium]